MGKYQLLQPNQIGLCEYEKAVLGVRELDKAQRGLKRELKRQT